MKVIEFIVALTMIFLVCVGFVSVVKSACDFISSDPESQEIASEAIDEPESIPSPEPIQVFDNSPEIDVIQYKQVAELSSMYPKLKPIMIKVFADDKITKDEYYDIIDEHLLIGDNDKLEEHKQTLRTFISAD